MDTSSVGAGRPDRGEADRLLERIDAALDEHRPEPDGAGGEDADELADAAARHYSTGKLTIAQARLVDRWRCQLAVSDRRWRTPDHRPPASSSDCIAAAVIDLLNVAEPDHLTLIRYAHRIRGDLALERGHAFPHASVVSFYLPATYAARADELLTAAQEHHGELLDQARAQARAESSGADRNTRAARTRAAIAELDIPPKVYKLPAGTLARLAIDRWRRRSPATVVTAAVEHGATHHQQHHRARRDMGTGQPHR